MSNLIRRTLVLLLVAAGCARSLPGEEPPLGALYYPSGLVASSGGETLYVVSSNFDLRFNTGWVSSLDLERLVTRVDAGEDVALSDLVTDQVNTTNLGGNIARSPDDRSLLVTHRGEAPLVLIEVDDQGALSCGTPDRSVELISRLDRTDCDEAHSLLVTAAEAEADALSGSAIVAQDVDDPYGVVLFSRVDSDQTARLWGAVSYLGSSAISILAIDPTAEKKLDHARLIRGSAGELGATSGIGALVPYPHPSQASCSSQLDPAVCAQATDCAWDGDASRCLSNRILLAGASQFLGLFRSSIYDVDVGAALDADEDDVRRFSVVSETGGDELTDIAFSPDGTKAYATNRIPDSVVVLDTRPQTLFEEDLTTSQLVVRERPAYQVLGATGLQQRPSSIEYLSRAAGDLVAVTSFDDDALFFLEPRGEGLVLRRRMERVARGPFRMTYLDLSSRQFLVVTTFFDHGLLVIDVTPADPQEFSVLLHLRDPNLPSSSVRG